MKGGRHLRGRFPATLALLVGSMLILTGSVPLCAQLAATRALFPGATASTNSAAPTPLESIPDRLAKVRAELGTATALDEASLTNRVPGFSSEDFSMRRGLLQRLAHLYEQQISFATELEALRRRTVEITAEAKAWTGFSEPRPYSILLADNLRESIQVLRTEIAGAESSLATLGRL